LRGGLPVTRWALAFLLLGCGGAGTTRLLQEGPRQPRLVLQGSCAPSVNSGLASMTTFTSQCVRSLNAPTLIDTAADFDALFELNCQQPAVDFATSRVLVVPARGATEWFVFPNFVMARSDALEVGLVIRPQGALPPDSLVVLPRTPEAVELRWCRSVCVENCDVAIP
jgi:hypothetical protein